MWNGVDNRKMKFDNACSLGPNTDEDVKKSNWNRMDCLAANQLKVERDPLKLKKWFASQDAEWQAARETRFASRLTTY
jgi:hypothetical protein